MSINRFELEKAGTHFYVREFDGIDDLSNIAADRVAQGADRLGNASLSGDYSFTGTRSLEGAVDLCDRGWSEGVEQISEVVGAIEIDPELLPSKDTLEGRFDVAGDEPDIDRYLQGDPENMVTYVPNIQTHGNIIDIVLNVSQHSSVDKEAIINRGAAVLAAIEALRSQGYSVGVLAIEQCSASYGHAVMQCKVPVIASGEAINVDTLAFATMHPSFLRRLIFAAQESEDGDIRTDFGFTGDGGYGRPLSIEGYEHDRPAYIIDKDDYLTTESKQVRKFAQSIAEGCFKALGANADSIE